MAKLAPWRPIVEMERWFDRVDRLFDRVLNRFFRQIDRDFWMLDQQWVPAMEVSETPDAYIVRVELPGVKREDIEVTLQDDILTIKGKKERSEEHKSEEMHFAERVYGEFVRSLRIPSDVKTDAIEASYKDGVLEIRLSKDERKKPRRIEVKVA